MPSGFNYSRWDKLELSDDEDTHPGAQFIEKNTLRRIKRESHEVHEQERKHKVQALQDEQAKGAWRRRTCTHRACRRRLRALTPLRACANTRHAQPTRRMRSWS
jgi:cell division cycle protein 37